MTTALTFAAGCVVGWTAYSIFVKWGVRLIGADDKARAKMLDRLGYRALVALRDSADAELSKRRPS